jgi:DNA-nicking Smr family endonuclease
VKKPTAADDVALFREQLADVIPMPAHDRAIHAKPRLRPIPLQHLRDEREALADSLSDHVSWDIGLETGEALVFLRPGLAQQTVRKLRRGHWVIQDELDLHGCTSAEARPMLIEFLAACVKHGTRCVRIIHGKGLGSRNREPVLKTKVANWLMQRDDILAFCEARPSDGGSGALIALLKSTGGRPRYRRGN